ncbi:MAG: hypothetical protein MJZ85_03540 [Bacteroidales bacterium]|nr:hypothetical protein [Bacteroidales bacterium]
MKDIDYEKIRSFVAEHNILEPTSIHGPEHWKYVERNGLLLAKLNGADETVVRLFALFHDSMRFNDFHDEEHGPRGAELAKKMRGKLYEVSDNQFEMLYAACHCHTTHSRTGILTIDTCFDADRLDLPRAGYIPNPKKMATSHGAKIADLGLKNKVSLKDYRKWIDTIDLNSL